MAQARSILNSRHSTTQRQLRQVPGHPLRPARYLRCQASALGQQTSMHSRQLNLQPAGHWSMLSAMEMFFLCGSLHEACAHAFHPSMPPEYITLLAALLSRVFGVKGFSEMLLFKWTLL
jgi:hypothetical protein